MIQPIAVEVRAPGGAAFRSLLAIVGPGTKTTRVTGLVPSVNYQFQIEEFRGTNVIDSNWIAVNTSAVSTNTSTTELSGSGDDRRIRSFRMKW